MPLTDTAVRNAKASEKPRKISDAGGLHLLVNPNGSKLWRVAYRFAGKQKLLALGAYPSVSLANARAQRDAAKQLLAQGVDPGEAKKADKRAEALAGDHTLAKVAKDWFEDQKPAWSEAHALRVWNRLERDVLAYLGKKHVAKVSAPEILEVLKRVEERGVTDVTKRLKQAVGQIYRYAIAKGLAEYDPSSGLRGALKASPRVQHHAKLSAKEMPDFLQKLEAYDGEPQTKLALQLMILTFVRTKELRFGVWSEFEGLDGDKPLWRIPADRMKAKREHLVPLAPQAVDLLREIKKYAGGSKFMFPSPGKDGVMSQNTLIFALYRMGYHSKLTVHGLRGTASTILNEYGFNRDWVERQLAHVEKDEVRAAYNAAEWLPDRRRMMAWWADYVDEQAKGSS